jgi:hypothetical protein
MGASGSKGKLPPVGATAITVAGRATDEHQMVFEPLLRAPYGRLINLVKRPNGVAHVKLLNGGKTVVVHFPAFIAPVVAGGMAPPPVVDDTVVVVKKPDIGFALWHGPQGVDDGRIFAVTERGGAWAYDRDGPGAADANEGAGASAGLDAGVDGGGAVKKKGKGFDPLDWIVGTDTGLASFDGLKTGTKVLAKHRDRWHPATLTAFALPTNEQRMRYNNIATAMRQLCEREGADEFDDAIGRISDPMAKPLQPWDAGNDAGCAMWVSRRGWGGYSGRDSVLG